MSAQASPFVLPLQQFLHSCSKALEGGDFKQSDAIVSELVESLTSISDAAISNRDDEEQQSNSVAALSYILSYLSNPSLDQAVIDALSFELPKAVAKFAGVSPRCSEIVESTIDLFTAKCTPRDMLSVFTEALGFYGKTTDAPGYVAALLRGVSNVFLSIQRRHCEQFKVAVPILLNALEAATFGLDDDDDIGLKKLFEGAMGIASSIQATCTNLEDGANEKLRGLLGLYALQIMTVLSISTGNSASTCLPFVVQLSSFFPYCGLSYADLITGQGVDPLISLVCSDDTDDFMDCFSYVKHGAVLSVIWGHISGEVSQAAEQDLSTLKDELRSSQSKRWSAIGVMQLVLYLRELPWVLKEHALDLLHLITEDVGQQDMNEDVICSIHTPRLIYTQQAILSIIMHAPTPELRKTAFAVLKRVLADHPSSLRFDIMQVLVRTSSSSSMVAILLDCVRENLLSDYLQLKNEAICSSNSFWNSGILDLVELILKPPSGGPPSLPEQTDAVISALNLYRYVLLTESSGKTNYTGVLSRSNLQKAYYDWLLPLRTVITSIIAENKDDHEQLALDIMCGLNPVEFVLYRCIELVEEQMKQSS